MSVTRVEDTFTTVNPDKRFIKVTPWTPTDAGVDWSVGEDVNTYSVTDRVDASDDAVIVPDDATQGLVAVSTSPTDADQTVTGTILQYDGAAGDDPAALVARWTGPYTSGSCYALVFQGGDEARLFKNVAGTWTELTVDTGITEGVDDVWELECFDAEKVVSQNASKNTTLSDTDNAVTQVGTGGYAMGISASGNSSADLEGSWKLTAFKLTDESDAGGAAPGPQLTLLGVG